MLQFNRDMFQYYIAPILLCSHEHGDLPPARQLVHLRPPNHVLVRPSSRHTFAGHG